MVKNQKTFSIFFLVIQNRYVQHGLFWALSIYLLFKLFNLNEDLQLTDLIYTGLFHFSLILLVYLNILILVPLLFQKSRYGLFFISSMVLVVLSSLFNQFTFTEIADWVFPGYYFISYYDFWDIIQFMAVYWALSTILKLAKSWFKVSEQEKTIYTLEQEKTQAELKALKAQLDPHFLFNSLNNIYSLALYEDQKTPEAILQLSHCLRYVLYDCKVPFIRLKKELEFLHNYLNISKLKSEYKDIIQLNIKGEAKDQEVAPLLFLPLVENALKHHGPNTKQQDWIHIDIEIQPYLFSFQIRNTLKPNDQLKQGPGGVGLVNLKQRLDLLYPKLHQSWQEQKDGIFESSLIVQLSKPIEK